MNKIIDLLGNQAEYYLGHTCKTIDKSLIHVPSADTIDKVWINSDRNIRTLNSRKLYWDTDDWPTPDMFPSSL